MVVGDLPRPTTNTPDVNGNLCIIINVDKADEHVNISSIISYCSVICYHKIF